MIWFITGFLLGGIIGLALGLLFVMIAEINRINKKYQTTKPTCPACGSTLVLDWPDKVQCRRCEHTWGR